MGVENNVESDRGSDEHSSHVEELGCRGAIEAVIDGRDEAAGYEDAYTSVI